MRRRNGRACGVLLAKGRIVVGRILVVDDERGIVFALRAYFLQRGFVVDTASNEEEAQVLLAGNSYTAAILDVHLSSRSGTGEGLNIAASIRERSPRTALIVMSGLESAENMRRALELGVDSFLRKPARLADVADMAVDFARQRAALYPA